VAAAGGLPVRLRIDEDAAVVAVGCLVAALPLASTSAPFWRRLKKP
jgi:predicted aconitase with swiveling domain